MVLLSLIELSQHFSDHLAEVIKGNILVGIGRGRKILVGRGSRSSIRTIEEGLRRGIDEGGVGSEDESQADQGYRFGHYLAYILL